MVRWYLLVGALAAVCGAGVSPGALAPAPGTVDRSPSDLAIAGDGSLVITANASSNSVSLVSLAAGRVLGEAAAGRHPFAVAAAGGVAVVTNEDSDDVTVFRLRGDRLIPAGRIDVGDRPRGVAIAPDGISSWVALAGGQQLVRLNLAAKSVQMRVPLPLEPWHVALSHSGSRLVVDCARSHDVCVLDAHSGKLLYRVGLGGGNTRHVAISPDDAWAYVPHIVERGMPVSRATISTGLIVGNRMSRVSLAGPAPRESVSLDTFGSAVGDLDGVAASDDGAVLAVTAGGTHEILTMPARLPYVKYGGPGDRIDPAMLAGPMQMHRIPLGGRPLGVAFLPHSHSVAVANYLTDAVQVVDADTGTVTATVPLGSAPAPSLEREGEAIFLDARRSWQRWYSCNTCHVEGNTNGSLFDTLNDGSYGTPKKVPSLRGCIRTGPWTWHGWQHSLRELVSGSLTRTMQGNAPTPHELDALMAYLATLDFRPNRRFAMLRPVEREAALRGERVFREKRCGECHPAPYFTNSGVYRVGLEEVRDPYRGFNPPSLRSVYDHAPYLHAGQADTLEEVLTRYHQPSRVTGLRDLNPSELRDLVAYLMTL